jgi:Holliday junction resolvase
MRRAAKIDANQEQVVSALRAAGVRVLSLAAVGKGVPDLLCSFRGLLILLEVKDGQKPPSARKLTPDQIEFHREWKDVPLYVVENPWDALKACGCVV